LIYLVFAIGCILATPRPNHGEDEIAAIKELKNKYGNEGQWLYDEAMHLDDPTKKIDGEMFHSTQQLTLMSLYMLLVTRRELAWKYLGKIFKSNL
jgi:hypothetical protein